MPLKIHMCPPKKRKKIRALKLHNISSLIIILNLVGFNSNERTSCGTSSQISTQKANRLPIPSIIDMQAAFVITMKSTLGFSGCGVPLCDQKRASQVLKPSTGELRNNLTPTSFLLLYNWFIFNATVNGSNPQQPASFPPPPTLSPLSTPEAGYNQLIGFGPQFIPLRFLHLVVFQCFFSPSLSLCHLT